MQNLVESFNRGTKMTEKGLSFFSDIRATIPAEMKLSKCSVALGKYNYAVILKNMSSAVNTCRTSNNQESREALGSLECRLIKLYLKSYKLCDYVTHYSIKIFEFGVTDNATITI
jgi:hypothetical protein